MLRPAVSRVCFLLLIGSVAWSGVTTLQNAGKLGLAYAGRALEITPNGSAAALRVVGENADAQFMRQQLSKASGLMFMYHSGCSVCAETMSAWLELARQARRGGQHLRVYALSVEPLNVQHDYWMDASAWGIQLLRLTDTAGVSVVAGTRTVPTTLVLRNGKVVAAHSSILGPLLRARVLDVLAREAP